MKSPSDKSPDDKTQHGDSLVTKSVLRLLAGAEAARRAHTHGEEEDVEVDERWLIAYADKMTLLCGLFVMLFAMSTIDKVKFEKVKESAEKSFGKATVEKPKEYVDIQTLNESKTQEVLLQEKIQQLEPRLRLLELQLRTAEETIGRKETVLNTLVAENELLRAREMKPPPPQETPQPSPEVPVKNDKREVQELLKQVTHLKTQNHELTTDLDLTTRQLKQLSVKASEPERQIEQLRVKNKEHERQIEELSVEKKERERQIEELKAAKPQTTFMSFIMSWTTVDHDIDLSVEDPSGKRFDFKHRKYENHPGAFVLDTRRGPGNEVWQSERVIPGVYKFKYSFYNPYGNTMPCPVTGTLVTPRGRFDLPKVTLDLDGKNEAQLAVTVDGVGNVTLKGAPKR